MILQKPSSLSESISPSSNGRSTTPNHFNTTRSQLEIRIHNFFLQMCSKEPSLPRKTSFCEFFYMIFVRKNSLRSAARCTPNRIHPKSPTGMSVYLKNQSYMKWRRMFFIHSGFETCFAPSIQGAEI